LQCSYILKDNKTVSAAAASILKFSHRRQWFITLGNWDALRLYTCYLCKLQADPPLHTTLETDGWNCIPSIRRRY